MPGSSDPATTSPRARLEGYFQRSHLRPAFWLALAGGVVLIYRGPGWQFIRFYVGDVLSVAFLYHLLSVFWRTTPVRRAVVIGSFAVGLELLQWARLAASPGSAAAVIVGSTFDAWDIVAYGVGLVLTVLIDGRRRPDASSSLPIGPRG